jgi:ribose-phosphate pyrophosphokinase
VIQGLHGGPDESPNDKLMKLLFFSAALKDNGARRVTAVVPYLAYARKDRQTKPRDPVTTRYVAKMIESSGINALLVTEVHNFAAFQNAFRIPTVHVDLRALLLDRAAELIGAGPAAVVSPDPGGVKRAQLFREALERRLGRPLGAAFLDKRRSAGVVTGDLLVGEVAGTRALIVDDMIASGGTMVRAARALKAAGAASATALAAHGLFTGEAAGTLADPALDGVIVTDTVPPFRLAGAALRVETVPAAPAVAEVIRRMAGGGPVSEVAGPLE